MYTFLHQKFFFVILFTILFSLFSCSTNGYDYDELYSSVGFEKGSSPAMNNYSPQAPQNYYYQQGQMMTNQPYQTQPQFQNQPYPTQYYPPAYSSPPYQVYPNAGSRFYTNPYAIPPSPYYQQYDADQYYVPPTYSYGIEQSGNNRKSTITR